MESQKEQKMEKSQKETEINLKARLFACYWGQEVLTSDMYGEGGLIYSATMKTNLKPNNDYLLLKPLSSITDEDAIEVAKLYFKGGGARGYHTSFNGRSLVNRISSETSTTAPNGFSKVIAVVDYLRSKGYALPYMGLSVEELANRGWIKLKH